MSFYDCQIVARKSGSIARSQSAKLRYATGTASHIPVTRDEQSSINNLEIFDIQYQSRSVAGICRRLSDPRFFPPTLNRFAGAGQAKTATAIKRD